MNEKPIERLNYFNGQRLQAADFKLEQDYHVRVRRWLNRSLYSSGIADGLTVTAIKGTPTVRISPGLALDPIGREIILIDEQDEIVPGAPLDAKNRPIGLYLTIRYAEDVTERVDGGCVVIGTSKNGSGNKAAWGGPSRVVADPVFEWSKELPLDSSGKVLLAYVALGIGCTDVSELDTSVRRYVGAASAAKVKQYALEGEGDVAAIPTSDPNTPITMTTKIRFHVRGRQPSAVTLYLKARQFSPLYYTELGQHTHGSSADTNEPETSAPVLHPEAGNPDKYKHLHTLTNVQAAGPGDHNHTDFEAPFDQHTDDTGKVLGTEHLQIGSPTYGNILPVLSASDGSFTAVITGATSHGHSLSGDMEKVQPTDDHTHTVPLLSISGAGVADVPARSGATAKSLSYVYDMKVAIDGVDFSVPIVDQIARTAPSDQTPWWTTLGDGTAGHPLADEKKDAIPIRIDYLQGVVLDEGEHSIECSVGLATGNAANGGRIHYNLYVE